ncbi:MAG: tRNA pseudouridine(38-40) synthase TruA [Parachlamydia sp.]|nr:tRNA pseudouridine(38-40) synthase TruA [Parachlamydia sp.]
MPRYKMTIAYDGTRYCGWQIQPNGVSIQSKIQDALQVALKAPHSIVGSGRTDAGVHARGQVAHFSPHEEIDLYPLHAALNGLLPADIRIKSLEEADSSFHAQYSAISKTYHYHLFLDRVMDPFQRLYTYQVRRKIDLSLLQQAADCFVGTHDFTTFANEAHAGSASRDPIRTLKRLDLVPEEGGIRLELEADGFLYKMVRNIVGTMLEVASGKRYLPEIAQLFDKKDRRQAGKAVPPQGLFLIKVDYSLKSHPAKESRTPHAS